MLQFYELSQRNKGQFFSQFEVLLMLTPFNGVSSRFFLNHDFS